MNQTKQKTAHKEEQLPPLPLLENWRREGDRLAGNVYGHPRFHDGEPIITSRVRWINLSAKLAQTLNTLYRLGKPA